MSIKLTSDTLLTGSLNITGSLTITGSVDSLNGYTGSLLGTASFADSALSSSFTPNAITTASVYLNELTFTKGDGSTFNLTVNTGSGGGGGGFPFTGSADITGSLRVTGPISNTITTITETQGTASVSGFTGSLFVMDCSKGNEFQLTLTSGSIAVLDPINITAGQEFTLKVFQSSSTIENLAASNLQFNTNIYNSDVSGRYVASTTVGQEDVIKFTSFNTSSLYAYGFQKNQVTQSLFLPAGFISASGGEVFTSGSFKIHKFTASADFVILSGGAGRTFDYVAVAGGGAGSGLTGGGGGGGGIATGSINWSSNDTWPIVIGAGGTGTTTSEVRGNAGNNTTISSSLVIAYGGGGGGYYEDGGLGFGANSSGSAGGGGSNEGGTQNLGGSHIGTVNIGSNGGDGHDGGSGAYAAGGGGGGSAVGGNASANTGGNGGAGLTITNISGSFTLAGGGGGTGWGTGGTGGTGGGGAGNADVFPYNGVNGTANTGGGGGGFARSGGTGGSGGSGVVYIKYQDTV